MYAPSELLEQVERQVRAEFNDQITSFEWWNEDEYTTIMVDIRELAWQIPMSIRCSDIVHDIIGDPDTSEYIVATCVSAIESVNATDGLFNLTFHGAGINSFFLHYYAPEREGTTPLKVSIHYTKMFDAVRTIKRDSPARFWQRLFAAREAYAKRQGVPSFSGDVLAKELQDFLLKHLDFIKHVAAATKKSLQILEPVPIPRQPTREIAQKPPYAPKVRQMALPVGVATVAT